MYLTKLQKLFGVILQDIKCGNCNSSIHHRVNQFVKERLYSGYDDFPVTFFWKFFFTIGVATLKK